jgi:hypothetical protein
MMIRRFALILATTCSVALASCDNDRPALDEKVGTYGKSLGEAKENPTTAQDLTTARQRFIASSQVQLGVLAAEIESRSRVTTIPIERIETLRKDYWLLVELRRQVLDTPDAGFDDALNQFESQVHTIREQIARVDRGQLP